MHKFFTRNCSDFFLPKLKKKEFKHKQVVLKFILLAVVKHENPSEEISEAHFADAMNYLHRGGRKLCRVRTIGRQLKYVHTSLTTIQKIFP